MDATEEYINRGCHNVVWHCKNRLWKEMNNIAENTYGSWFMKKKSMKEVESSRELR